MEPLGPRGEPVRNIDAWNDFWWKTHPATAARSNVAARHSHHRG
jgi:hypothetical protein